MARLIERLVMKHRLSKSEIIRLALYRLEGVQ